MVDVKGLWTAPLHYAGIQVEDTGEMLTDLYPDRMLAIMLMDNTILEVRNCRKDEIDQWGLS